MSRYKPYPAYKDSGVEWIGEVPEHWAVRSVKYLYNARLGKMVQPLPKSEKDVLVPYHRAQTVQWECIKYDQVESMWANPTEIDTYSLEDGDLLICEGGDVCRAAMFNRVERETVIFQNSIHRVRPVGGNHPEWLLRLMQHVRSSGWIDVLCNKNTIVHFTSDKLASLECPNPPCSEQSEILSALGRETAHIDALIAKKTRFIGLLKEKRQALISHAVTKGLNPNVKMKDSGVEWIGEVPEHWEVKRLKHLLEEPLQYGANESGDASIEDGPRYIRITDLNEAGELRHDSVKRLPTYVAQPYMLRDGDVLFARSGATVGKTYCYRSEHGPACFAGYLIRARLNRRKINPDFLILAVQSHYYWAYILKTAIQATIENVSAERYGDFPVAMPNCKEQNTIIAVLSSILARIDTLTEKTQRSINLLKERRSAFITAAVTGQIDLRESI
mgnify:CR=1 FL=1